MARDITNEQFGRLTAIRVHHKEPKIGQCWSCACSCGESCVVNRSNLVAGTTRSCGCIRSEVASASMAKKMEKARGKEGRAPVYYKTEIDVNFNHIDQSWLWHDGVPHQIMTCPVLVFKAALSACINIRTLVRDTKAIFDQKNLDAFDRWYLLLEIANAGHPMKIYSTKEEALAAHSFKKTG